MVSFVLIVNKKGQTRYSRYFDSIPLKEDIPTFEFEIATQCIKRPPHHTLFFNYDGLNIVYRNYASLFIIVGSNKEENEFSLLEWIQLFVETMDAYFDRVTELDLLFQLEKVHMIIEELLPKGIVGETSQERILSPFLLQADF
ncbi:unnamed protein product [Cunninghamella blakesleeana]